jgi:hypothetical protein
VAVGLFDVRNNKAIITMNPLHTKIKSVDDDAFQQLVDEVYHCIGWSRDDDNFTTLWELLSAIGRESPKVLSATYLPTEGVITTKVCKLPEGFVYSLCAEIACLKGTHLDDEKKVVSLLRLVLPVPPRRRSPSRKALAHEAEIRVIRQRRKNGDL